jgi:hypothetical protein
MPGRHVSLRWFLAWPQRPPAPLERPSQPKPRPGSEIPQKSPTAITHDWSALFVLSSVWQSLSNLEVVGNTGNMSSEKAGVGGSTPSLATIIPNHLFHSNETSQSALGPLWFDGLDPVPWPS